LKAYKLTESHLPNILLLLTFLCLPPLAGLVRLYTITQAERPAEHYPHARIEEPKGYEHAQNIAKIEGAEQSSAKSLFAKVHTSLVPALLTVAQRA